MQSPLLSNLYPTYCATWSRFPLPYTQYIQLHFSIDNPIQWSPPQDVKCHHNPALPIQITKFSPNPVTAQIISSTAYSNSLLATRHQFTVFMFEIPCNLPTPARWMGNALNSSEQDHLWNSTVINSMRHNTPLQANRCPDSQKNSCCFVKSNINFSVH